MKISLYIKNVLYLCINVTNDVLASFMQFSKSIRLRAITNRNRKTSQHLWSGFSLCRQASFSTELDLLGIYLPKNNSVKFFDSLCETCMLFRRLKSYDCMVYQTQSTHLAGWENCQIKLLYAFQYKMLKNERQQNPQMQD
jgi:hypothetical protein